MKWFGPILNTITFVILSYTLLITYNRTDLINKAFDTKRLDTALDYCTEAAFLEAVDTGTLENDYSNLYNITLNPENSLDIFERMMCINYNMSTSEANMKAVEDNIVAALMACNDGYYISDFESIQDESKNTIHPLMWSLKRPYTLTVYNNSKALTEAEQKASGIKGVYSVHLADRQGILLKNNGTPVYFTDYTKAEDASKLTGYKINDTLVRGAISKSITDNLRDAIEKKYQMQGGVTYNFYIPMKDTESGINSINYPSLLFIFNGGDFTGKVTRRQVSLGGFKVARRVEVIGYVRKINGVDRKLYCYESQIPSTVISTLDVREKFATIEDAAQSGYTPDYTYIYNLINTDLGEELVPGD